MLGNQPPDGGFASFDDANTLPVWLQAAGYRTIHIGKYLNGYGQNASDPAYVPPGWDEWNAATAGTTQTVYDYTLNRNGSLVDYGSAPSDFKQDVFSDLAVEAINRNAPGGPFFLGVMYTAPHSGGPNPNPHPPADCAASAKPAPRHAGAFDSEPLPQPPSFNEADVSDKPAASATRPRSPRRRRRRSSAGIAAGSSHCSRSTMASAGSSMRWPRPASSTRPLIVFTADNGFFHGEHRVQTGKNRVYEEAIAGAAA